MQEVARWKLDVKMTVIEIPTNVGVPMLYTSSSHAEETQYHKLYVIEEALTKLGALKVGDVIRITSCKWDEWASPKVFYACDFTVCE